MCFLLGFGIVGSIIIIIISITVFVHSLAVDFILFFFTFYVQTTRVKLTYHLMYSYIKSMSERERKNGWDMYIGIVDMTVLT